MDVATPRSPGEIPDHQNHGHHEKGTASNHPGDERRINLLDRACVSRHIGFIQAFARMAVKGDTWVTEDGRDQLVHRRFLELATIVLATTLRREGRERSRTLDGLLEKFTNIDRTLLTTQHASRNTLALDGLARILGLVGVVVGLQVPVARIQSTVERLLLVDPELEIAGMVLLFAGESHLRLALAEELQDLPVCHITHLKVLLDGDSFLVTHTTFAIGHQGITRIIRLADIAVDAIPSIVTVTVFAVAHRTVGVGRRSTDRFGAIEATKAWRTNTAAG